MKLFGKSKGKTENQDVDTQDSQEAVTSVSVRKNEVMEGKQHTITDAASGMTYTINGQVITNEDGILPLPQEQRTHLVATSDGQVFISKTEAHNPLLLSQVKTLELRIQHEHQIHEVDISTISEIYRKLAPKSQNARTEKKNIDTSKMQREMIAIVAQAASRNTSDIHMIVNQTRAVVRFRIDGVMRDITEFQPNYAFEMLAAAFALADESDTAYQMKSYQGARISSLKTTLPQGVQSIRLQFNPLANDGRYLIMRLLYSGSGKVTALSDLGYNQKQVDMLKTMSARPVGINIVSGPTGSGKSTTLKAVLEGMIERRMGEINTITIEDPPEYVIMAAQQMPVTNAKTQEERAAAFIQAISAGLRSDPDVLMIGELRDRASADLAVEGALSGHPVYASLHANTAMDILSRLRDMGIEDFKVFDATVFSGLVGQRLVRKLCPHCRIPYNKVKGSGLLDPLFEKRVDKMIAITPEDMRRPLYIAGPGCQHCSGGYQGRSVISEIILPDDTFMELMGQNQKSKARSYWFKELQGMDLLGSAWMRALQGRVSPVDIENTVSLISPIPEHTEALKYWEDL